VFQGHITSKLVIFQIGKMRFVSVSEFKGKKLVNIREYYMDNEGETKPGRKGNSDFLNVIFGRSILLMVV